MPIVTRGSGHRFATLDPVGWSFNAVPPVAEYTQMEAEAHASLIDEMAQVVARAARVSPEQGGLAVAAMLQFLTARLPSALVGELHARLGSPAAHHGRPTEGSR